MPNVMRTAARTTAIAEALAGLLKYLQFGDSLRGQPGICDFLLGNPQEMPLPGFVGAIQRHTEPRNKDWFA
jgi:aspartate aminotransferase